MSSTEIDRAPNNTEGNTMFRNATLTSAMLCITITSVCLGAVKTNTNTEEPSKLRAQPDQDLVEIIIRLPDGRVIKRKEPRIASRLDTDLPFFSTSRPPVVQGGSTKHSGADVNQAGDAVTGGSNSSSVKLGGGGGGGGGGSSSSIGGGGGGGGNGHGGGGGSLDDQSSSVEYDNSLLLDADPRVWIYAWQDTGGPFDNLTFNIEVNPRNKTPQRLAQLVAMEAQDRSMDRVVLRLKNEFIPATREPFDVTNPSELLNTGGYRDGLVEYWNTFAIELRDRGVTPDFIIMDQEDGIDFYALDQAEQEHLFTAMIDSPSLIEPDAPRLMRELRYDQFRLLQTPESRAARYEYHAYALKFRARFLREVFLNAFDSAYGHHIPISNYNESNPSFEVRRYTNFPVPNATIADVSSPICYLTIVPDWGLFANTTKDVRWNMLITNLNVCRSNAANGPVVPWVAAPGYGIRGQNTWARLSEIDQEMQLWEMQMRHMIAMGIDNFILWNPIPRYNSNAAVSDRLVDEWHASNRIAPTQLMTDLAPIPLDADQIETNGVVTTYEEYVQMMGIDNGQ